MNLTNLPQLSKKMPAADAPLAKRKRQLRRFMHVTLAGRQIGGPM
jgi:hypothetical protein